MIILEDKLYYRNDDQDIESEYTLKAELIQNGEDFFEGSIPVRMMELKFSIFKNDLIEDINNWKYSINSFIIGDENCYNYYESIPLKKNIKETFIFKYPLCIPYISFLLNELYFYKNNIQYFSSLDGTNIEIPSNVDINNLTVLETSFTISEYGDELIYKYTPTYKVGRFSGELTCNLSLKHKYTKGISGRISTDKLYGKDFNSNVSSNEETLFVEFNINPSEYENTNEITLCTISQNQIGAISLYNGYQQGINIYTTHPESYYYPSHYEYKSYIYLEDSDNSIEYTIPFEEKLFTFEEIYYPDIFIIDTQNKKEHHHFFKKADSILEIDLSNFNNTKWLTPLYKEQSLQKWVWLDECYSFDRIEKITDEYNSYYYDTIIRERENGDILPIPSKYNINGKPSIKNYIYAIWNPYNGICIDYNGGIDNKNKTYDLFITNNPYLNNNDTIELEVTLNDIKNVNKSHFKLSGIDGDNTSVNSVLPRESARWDGYLDEGEEYIGKYFYFSHFDEYSLSWEPISFIRFYDNGTIEMHNHKDFLHTEYSKFQFKKDGIYFHEIKENQDKIKITDKGDLYCKQIKFIEE